MERNNKTLVIAMIIYLAVVFIGTKLFPSEKEPNFQDWDKVQACEMAVGQFADRYTDMWHEHMEQCVYLDADYLQPAFEETEQ